VRETGPGPLRTALGAGRLLLVREELVRLELGRVRLVVLRVREVELLELVFGFDFDVVLLAVDLDEDVLLLRDPGGEDVRVAMLEGYANVTPVTRTTRCVSPSRSASRHL
jgi:hypothetical protein